MLNYAWIQNIRQLVFVAYVFAITCVAGYCYYLSANQHAVVSRVSDACNAIAGVLSVFISAQVDDPVNNPSSLRLRHDSEAVTSNGVLLNASKPVKGIKYLSYQPPGNTKLSPLWT